MCVEGGVADLSYPSSQTRRGRVQENGLICPTIQTENHLYQLGRMGDDLGETEYRIRKLTPNEVWRLMGFSDADFKKAEAVNSNTQLYQQAGNSIVKQVLISLFRNLVKENKDED